MATITLSDSDKQAIETSTNSMMQGLDSPRLSALLQDLLQKSRHENTSPKRPRLEFRHTSEEAMSYAVAMKQYEQDLAEFQRRTVMSDYQINMVRDAIPDAIIKEHGLKSLSKKLNLKAYQYAYEESHSNGHNSVIDTFEEVLYLMADSYKEGLEAGKSKD